VRWHLVLLFILLFPHSVHGAFEFLDVGARPAAMGGAFCAVADDAHALHYNAAGMGQLQGRRASVSTCQYFGLAGPSMHNISLLQSASWGVLGLEVQRFGQDLYRETALGLSFGRSLLEALSLGISLRGLQLAISGYGSAQTFGLDLGFLAAMTPRFRWGVWVYNLNNGRLGRSRQEMPQVFIMGFAYRPDSKLLLSADLLLDIADCSVEKLARGAYPVELRLGQESRLWNPVALRLGLQTRPTRFSAGLGLEAGHLSLDYAYRSHQFLGGTHYVSLSWP